LRPPACAARSGGDPGGGSSRSRREPSGPSGPDLSRRAAQGRRPARAPRDLAAPASWTPRYPAPAPPPTPPRPRLFFASSHGAPGTPPQAPPRPPPVPPRHGAPSVGSPAPLSPQTSSRPLLPEKFSGPSPRLTPGFAARCSSCQEPCSSRPVGVSSQWQDEGDSLRLLQGSWGLLFHLTVFSFFLSLFLSLFLSF